MEFLRFIGWLLVGTGVLLMVTAEIRRRRRWKIKSWRFLGGYLLFAAGGLVVLL